MDVQLFVYDLSQGLARQLSRDLLGTYIDAVYHTSIVVGGVEYFFGYGINTCRPGTTHFGSPMEKIALGTTELPVEVILEYVESLKETYSPESYDLFAHNCNNFSHDLAMFLVGKGIPSHITSLPQTVLNTPFGQMLKPQLDKQMRTVTQAPVPPQQRVDPRQASKSKPQAATNGAAKPSSAVSQPSSNGTPSSNQEGKVHNITSTSELSRLLSTASEKCAVIFFTSSTCAPCKIVYPAYDALAAEAGSKAIFIKVDINYAYDIAQQFGIRATPTFKTFLKGEKQDEWQGANEAQLRGNVRLLLEAAYPPHLHSRLNVPNLQKASLSPVTYGKVPPLDKLISKMGDFGQELSIQTLKQFVEERTQNGSSQAPLPDLSAISTFFESAVARLPPETIFAAVDLLRTATIDSRISGYFAEDPQGTVGKLLQHVNNLHDAPYNLRLVTIYLACNLFTSPLWSRTLEAKGSNTSALMVHLVTTTLLDDKHPNLRVAAASLAFNLTATNYRIRREEEREWLPEEEQVELAASLLETLSVEEESKEAVRAMILALGWSVFYAPAGNEVWDLCKVMDGSNIVRNKEKLSGNDPLVKEIGRELLGEGLK
ncbi:MAG: hypothetical protein M1820_001980 [Bogoriella megaspora]|nr:MAG: hypothetical protein M1820_001980 [Bogoriella megaspora]